MDIFLQQFSFFTRAIARHYMRTYLLFNCGILFHKTFWSLSVVLVIDIELSCFLEKRAVNIFIFRSASWAHEGVFLPKSRIAGYVHFKFS